MNARQLLAQVLDILGISAENQQRMIGQVDEILQLTVLNDLLEKLEKKDQEALQLRLKDKKPEEQQTILHEYLRGRYTEKEIQDTYLVAAAREVVPDYIRTLLEVATEEQKKEVGHLLQSLDVGR